MVFCLDLDGPTGQFDKKEKNASTLISFFKARKKRREEKNELYMIF